VKRITRFLLTVTTLAATSLATGSAFAQGSKPQGGSPITIDPASQISASVALTTDLPLVYPEDLATFGTPYVIVIDRPLAGADTSAANPQGWYGNNTTSFVIDDKANGHSAFIYSFAYSYTSTNQMRQAMNAIKRLSHDTSVASEQDLQVLRDRDTFSSISVADTPDGGLRYVILAGLRSTLLDTNIMVEKQDEEYGKHIVASIISKMAKGEMVTKTLFSESRNPNSSQHAQITPDIYSTRASASYWSNCTDGAGGHTIAVWTGLATSSTSTRQFNFDDYGAWSWVSGYGFIKDWGTPCSTSMPGNQYWLGVPDFSWLNACIDAVNPYRPCPSYAPRHTISNYSANSQVDNNASMDRNM